MDAMLFAGGISIACWLMFWLGMLTERFKR
jgi:hypothetical protein